MKNKIILFCLLFSSNYLFSQLVSIPNTTDSLLTLTIKKSQVKNIIKGLKQEENLKQRIDSLHNYIALDQNLINQQAKALDQYKANEALSNQIQNDLKDQIALLNEKQEYHILASKIKLKKVRRKNRKIWLLLGIGGTLLTQQLLIK